MNYPPDPNHLFSKLVDVNTYVARMRDHGWQVKLSVTENGSRVFVQVAASRSCDPPTPEGEAE